MTIFTQETDGTITRSAPAASIAEISIPNGESARHEVYATIVIEGLGEIELTLDQKAAPNTVENFVTYAEKGHYDGLIFHRVIPGFMIQGGGFDDKMSQKLGGPPIKNEATNGLKNKKYTIAMARTSDPHSATSQFFINVADNGFLNHTAQSAQGWGYCVFGEVTKGQDIVDKIAAVVTSRRGFHDDVPKDAVVIKTIKIEGEAVGTHLDAPAAAASEESK